MTSTYYNEFEPYAAQWLRNLILAGHLPRGDVDERSITEVQPDDLRGYAQAHFFAGIGGWPLALRLAGWSDERPVWTGSCPCQPFSEAGKRRGQQDERHLWPHWYRLISQSKPSTIFGEQTSKGIFYGWLDDAFSDLEKENYACAAAVLPAVGVAAPHERSRIFFVAHAAGIRCQDNQPQSRSVSESKKDWRVPQFARDSYRETEPGMGRVADGLSEDMDAIEAYGNAIVPPLAAEFVAAFMECRP